MVLQDPRDGVLYAALAHEHFGNKLHRLEDGGTTWQEIAVPAYPPKPHDVPAIKDPIGGIEIPWRLELIWELQPDPTDDGGLCCGTIPGGLFRSADRSENWQLVRSLWNQPARAEWMGGGYDYPGIYSVLVDPRDLTKVSVGVSCGGV